LSNIDPEIRNLVAELNTEGYHTDMSCAGHYDPNTTKATRGWLMFSRPWEQSGILAILAKHNLTGVRIGFAPNMPTILMATFDPIGQPRELYDVEAGTTYEPLDDDKEYGEG
jgi:hypothetical protein